MSLDWYHSSEDEDYVPCEVLSDESVSSEEEVIPEEASAGPAQKPIKGKRRAFKRAMNDIRVEISRDQAAEADAKAAKKKPTKRPKQAPSKK